MDRTTAKLLINSLWLGMKPYQDIVNFIDNNKAEEIFSKSHVKEQYDITYKIEFIRSENKPIFGFKDEYLNFKLECDSKKFKNYYKGKSSK